MQFFKPLMAGAQLGDRLVACAGTTIGIALTIVVCTPLPLATAGLPIIVAPLGASAVLVFAVPASPLAQPWPVVGGNVISTLIGVAAFRAVPDATVAAGVAVGAAVLVMSLLRCLHPPGGAAALTAVIGGEAIHAAGWFFAFAPVAINSVALVALAMVFHRISGHSYPHEPALSPQAAATVREAAGFHLEDINRALAELPDSADLDLLLSRAEVHAKRRREDRRG
jgi:CBS domain-containing membrane protein